MIIVHSKHIFTVTQHLSVAASFSSATAAKNRSPATMADVHFIVSKLNAPPFSLGVSLISFRSDAGLVDCAGRLHGSHGADNSRCLDAVKRSPMSCCSSSVNCCRSLCRKHCRWALQAATQSVPTSRSQQQQRNSALLNPLLLLLLLLCTQRDAASGLPEQTADRLAGWLRMVKHQPNMDP